MREPKPSLSSTSVNFSEFNEISTLNDTVKMDDDESELIIESRLKNDQSLSSTITSEPSNVNDNINDKLFFNISFKFFFFHL